MQGDTHTHTYYLYDINCYSMPLYASYLNKPRYVRYKTLRPIIFAYTSTLRISFKYCIRGKIYFEEIDFHCLPRSLLSLPVITGNSING